MAGSAPRPADEQRRTRDESKPLRRRSQSAEEGTKVRGSAQSVDRVEQQRQHRERDHVRESKPNPPHFSSSHKHPSPHHHHHRPRERSRSGRGSPSHTSRRRFADEDRPASSRKERSVERPTSHHYHSHRYADTNSSHKRRHSRSPSLAAEEGRPHKRRRSISPAAPSSRTELFSHSRPSKDDRARSPRPALADDAVAARRSRPDLFASSHRRHRSRSIDSQAEKGGARGRRPSSPEGFRRREKEDFHHRQQPPSPRRDARRRYSRSPPPPGQRGFRADRERDRGPVRDEESFRSSRARYSPPPLRKTYPPPRSRLSRSPRDSRSRRESRDNVRTDADHPPSRNNREAQRRRSLSRESQRSRHDEKEKNGEMYNRGPYDPRYGAYHSSHTPYGNSYPPSSYGSHAGSPVHGYPPQQSPHSYQQSQPVPYYQPQPGRQYGGTPNHPTYPPRDSLSRPAQRGGPAARGGRGHFANLSWTPGDGTKGGHLVQPGDDDKERKGSASGAPKPQLSSVIAASPEEDDNPFRPPADLRAEDESARKKRKVSLPEANAASPPPPPVIASKITETKAEAEGSKNKISFSIKGRASAAAAEKALPVTPKPQTIDTATKRPPVPVSPLVQNNIPKSRNYEGNTRVGDAPKPAPVKIEKVKKKRLKARPELSEDFSVSESVYFRKTGNDSVVGSGTYGKVYKAVHVYTGAPVALKKIRMEGERDGYPVTAIREVKLLQSLNHTNVVALHEVMVERNDCFMTFEYLSHDLTGLLNHPTFTLTSAHKKHLAKQLFEGLHYLHDRGVLHRDIKAANILISNTGELKLADFGLARFYLKHQRQDYTNRVITIWYRSPELLLGETQYGPAVDIWSAACVLVEIFTRHAIFPGDGGEINQLDKIYNVLGTPSRTDWPGIDELQWYTLLRPRQRIVPSFAEKYQNRVSAQAFELLREMFAYDPATRPTAAEVLQHAYFNSEEPAPLRVWELKGLEGDWHEFESKALRKEKDREARRREREGGVASASASGAGVVGKDEEREKRKREEDLGKGGEKKAKVVGGSGEAEAA